MNVPLINVNQHCKGTTVDLQDIMKQWQIFCRLLMCTTDADLTYYNDIGNKLHEKGQNAHTNYIGQEAKYTITFNLNKGALNQFYEQWVNSTIICFDYDSRVLNSYCTRQKRKKSFLRLHHLGQYYSVFFIEKTMSTRENNARFGFCVSDNPMRYFQEMLRAEN